MSLKAEQIARDILPIPAGNAKKAAKRAKARKLRRQAKRNPEQAPKKLAYDGWYW
jgi:hypothetical protein